jgi:hypothetical protein
MVTVVGVFDTNVGAPGTVGATVSVNAVEK